MEAGRVAERIHQRVDLRGRPALAAADGLILTPFLRAPALCWWARTIVESIMAYSLSASAARCWNTRSHTPALAQRLKRVCTLTPQPNRSGRSRHGTPVRKR